MSYTEPGVYTEIINNQPNTGITPTMVPLVIGEGPQYFDHIEVPMIRGGVSTMINGTGVCVGSPVSLLATGSQTITVTTAGTFTITLAAGCTGTATSGIGGNGATITGSPVALTLGSSTVLTTTSTGTFTVSITANLIDTFPSSLVTAITSVYTLNGVIPGIVPPGTSGTPNFTLTAPNSITWTAAGTTLIPAGTSYYVDYEARPEITQYVTTYVTSFAELAAYASNPNTPNEFMKTASCGPETTVNPVYLGAYTVLEAGASGTYIIQVQPGGLSGGTYTVAMAFDMPNALIQAQTVSTSYFLVPMLNGTNDSPGVGATQGIGQAAVSVIAHCDNMSTTTERNERICFINPNIPAPAATNGIYTNAEIAGFTLVPMAVFDQRARMPFVSSVTDTLSDGNLHTLGGEYVCAALAGLAASIPVQRALTRQKLYNFTSYNYLSTISRTNLNALAAAGFIDITQPGGPGSPGIIRHGVTTCMNGNLENQEHSIVTIVDYVAKYLRASLDGYIGIFNIDNFLVSKVTGTLNSCTTYLVNKVHILVSLTVGDISQDSSASDTLLVTVTVLPPYPCNYIDITILVD